jgi:hypothetical protein
MPPEQRGWRDEERAPARSRQQPTCCRKKDAIGRRQPRSPRLPTEDGQLVPEHDDLELLEVVRAGTQRCELEHAAEQQVAERPEQRPAPLDQRDGSTTLRSRSASQPEDRVNAPHTLFRSRSRRRAAICDVHAASTSVRALVSPALSLSSSRIAMLASGPATLCVRLLRHRRLALAHRHARRCPRCVYSLGLWCA